MDAVMLSDAALFLSTVKYMDGPFSKLMLKESIESSGFSFLRAERLPPIKRLLSEQFKRTSRFAQPVNTVFSIRLAIASRWPGLKVNDGLTWMVLLFKYISTPPIYK